MVHCPPVEVGPYCGHQLVEAIEVLQSTRLGGRQQAFQIQLPDGLCVPNRSFRQITAEGSARSDLLLVGSTT